MKKRIIFIILLFVSIISIILYNKEENNIVYESQKVYKKEYTSSISMMLETDQDSGMYEVTDVSGWPDTSLYTFNETLSKCENGSSVSWDSSNNTIVFSGNSVDRCYIYFDVYVEPTYTISDILSTKKISERTDFSVAFTEDTTGIVYETKDNDGDTYYWAGDATDNYVYFAGFYWRIVRVNGDGTLRLIYDGTEPHGNGEVNSDRYISGAIQSYGSYNNMCYFSVSFSGSADYIYYSSGESSGLKYELDYWYSKYLEDTEYEEYVYQSGKFCNDTEVYSDISYTMSGTYFYNIAYYPNYRVTSYTPSLECSNESDIYNIGALSSDEVNFAGGAYGTTNTNYYLYIGYVYWTMSPSVLNGGFSIYPYVFAVGSTGDISSIGGSMSSYAYAKPVINLNSNILLTGDGTINNAYKVVGTS